MILPDVNVLVAAFQEDHSFHQTCRAWLERTLRSDQAYGVAELALSGFVRVVTSPRAMRHPATLDDAFQFAEAILRPSHAVRLSPGSRHWDIFTRLCRDAHIKGDTITDAYFAALAIEHGCEWITLDSDFGRFRDLRWRRPTP